MPSPLKARRNGPPMSGDEWFKYTKEEKARLKTPEQAKLEEMEEARQQSMLKKIELVPAEQEQQRERWAEWLTRWVYCTEGAHLTLTDIRYARVFADKTHRSQGAAENCATFIRDDEELERAIGRKLNGVLEVTSSKIPYYDSKIVKALVSAGIEPPPTTVLTIAESKFLGPGSFAKLQQMELSHAVHLGRQELLNACIRFLKTEEIQLKVEIYAAKYPTAQDLSSRQAARLYSDLSAHHPFFKYVIRSVFPLAKALVDTFRSLKTIDKSRKEDKPQLKVEGLVPGLLKELQSIFPAWKYLTDLGRRVASDGGPFNHTVTFAHVLVEHSSVELVEEYLRQGGDVNVGGPRWTLLQAAVSMHTYNSRMNKIVDLLLEHGAYVTLSKAEHGSALRTAAIYGKWVLLEKLLVWCLFSGAWKIANDLRFIMDVMDEQGGINPGENFSDLPAPERIALYAKRQVIRIIEDQIHRDEQVIKRHP
ncbi:uncharacterized protein N7498_004278 [Penicillium cinerascens]|uniref:Uncharacterized protein n=1 Tax=Penicillium cinerascens TaxID=70096 RepID=A0A9W9N3S8_9EURO|nr:uncharacterized protein N7498_004278 [Penicillium cinerascens]KAJ5212632.1 hypothetical protein N7498_004278 [Penicillium cinerascens]